MWIKSLNAYKFLQSLAERVMLRGCTVNTGTLLQTPHFGNEVLGKVGEDVTCDLSQNSVIETDQLDRPELGCSNSLELLLYVKHSFVLISISVSYSVNR